MTDAMFVPIDDLEGRVAGEVDRLLAEDARRLKGSAPLRGRGHLGAVAGKRSRVRIVVAPYRLDGIL